MRAHEGMVGFADGGEVEQQPAAGGLGAALGAAGPALGALVGSVVRRRPGAQRGLPSVEGFRPVFPQPQRMMPEGERVPGGRYLEMPERADVTGQVRGGARVEIGPDGRPVFLASPEQVPDVEAGHRVRTNLFRRSAGWDWVGEPPAGAADHPFLVSVESGNRHHYALGTDFEGPVAMARYPRATSEPRLRPTARGDVELGEQVGTISVRGAEHPVYDRVYVVRPGDEREKAPRYAEGGRVGGLAAALQALVGSPAVREGVAARTRQNPRGLPMDEASRRARAEAMGFDMDRRYLHGTHNDFEGFDPEAGRTGVSLDGERATFVTDSPATADSYLAGNHVALENFPEALPIGPDVGRLYHPDARVVPVVLRDRDEMVEWDMGRAKYSPELVQRVLRDARSEGAPGAVMENFRDPGIMNFGVFGSGGRPAETVAVFDSARMRSPHATFDPQRMDETDLLAGLGGAAVLGAGAAEGLIGGQEEAPRYQDGGRVGAISQGLAAAIRAYHGSPHRFDRFDYSRIGTGEGAQAYGHGLYFAESEDVARHYRKALARAGSDDGLLIDGAPVRDLRAGRQADTAWMQALDMAERTPRSWMGGDDIADVLRPVMLQDARDMVDGAERPFRMAERAGRFPGGEEGRRWAEQDVAFSRQVAEHLRGIAGRGLGYRQPGAMYEVNLHVDPDRLLQWDRPMAAQTAPVQRALRDLLGEGEYADASRAGWATHVLPGGGRMPPPPELDGGAAYEQLARQRGREVMLGPPDDPSRQYPVQASDDPAASAALLERGIPGIRYLDGTSRGRGQGTSNHVLFSDEPVEIVRRYARGGLAEAPGYSDGGEVADLDVPGGSTASRAARRLAAFRRLRAIEPAFRAGLERFVRERPIGIAAPEAAAEAILRDGRFKTQFETGTSGGIIKPDGSPSSLRIAAEERVFGLPEDLPPEQRPVYGALRTGRLEEALTLGSRESHAAPWRSPWHYGDHVFLLGDEAKGRSTYTWGDSLGVGLPSQRGVMSRAYRFDEPVASPRELAMELPPSGYDSRRDPIRLVDRLRDDRARGMAAPDGFSLRAWPESYVETQTPGPVPVSDVRALLVREGERRDAIHGLARERGIPVWTHDEVTLDDSLQRHLGLRAAGAGVGAGVAAEGLIGGQDDPPRYQEGGRVGAVGRGLEAAIRAYHGSPHRFDRFDISRIGTGEGVAAYGRGLYFAGSEDVARHYRDTLAPPLVSLDGEAISNPTGNWSDALADLWKQGRITPAQKEALSYVTAAPSLDHAIGNLRAQGAQAWRGPSAAREWAARADTLEAMRDRVALTPQGHMYEVDLRVDPARLLDWDRPLPEQPGGAAVERILRDVVPRRALRENPGALWSLEQAMSAITGHGKYFDPTPPGGEPSNVLRGHASERFRDAGIPGLRYLDGNSRGAGEGTSNFVMFSDEPVEIVRRYAQGGLAGSDAQPQGGMNNNIPGPADELASNLGAAQRGALQAAQLWEAAGQAMRGGLAGAVP
jgi:hypothetical protein